MIKKNGDLSREAQLLHRVAELEVLLRESEAKRTRGEEHDEFQRMTGQNIALMRVLNRCLRALRVDK